MVLRNLICHHPKIRGRYVPVEKSTHSIFSYKFHNITLVCESNKINVSERIKWSESLNPEIKIIFVLRFLIIKKDL